MFLQSFGSVLNGRYSVLSNRWKEQRSTLGVGGGARLQNPFTVREEKIGAMVALRGVWPDRKHHLRLGQCDSIALIRMIKWKDHNGAEIWNIWNGPAETVILDQW